jgi:hypothetical protein
MHDQVRLDLPSASDTAFWNCPGQFQLKRSIPQEQRDAIDAPDEFTSSGNRVDKARETGNTLELSREEADLYESGLKFEQLLVNGWADQFNLKEFKPGPCKDRLWLNNADTLAPLVSGESDVHYISTDNRRVLIIDWKLIGPTVSRAMRNTQLRVLAVLKSVDMERNVDGIRVAINRCAAKVGGNDYCDYGPEDLRHSEQWILYHLWLSREEDAPRRAGVWCDHCPCKAYCPEAGAYALLPSVIAKRSIAEIDRTPEEMVASLGPVDCKRIWESSAVIGKIVDAVKARIKGMTAEQLAEIGLELAEGRKLDPITDTKGALEVLSAQGLPQDSLWACLSVVKTDLGKLLVTHLGVANAKLASEWISLKLDPFITRQQSDKMIKLAK